MGENRMDNFIYEPFNLLLASYLSQIKLTYEYPIVWQATWGHITYPRLA